MSTAKLVINKIAIVGMDAYFESYPSLDAFERSVYEGDACEAVNSSAEIAKEIDRVTENALEDAAIDKGASIAVVMVTNTEYKLQNIQARTVAKADSVFDGWLTAQKLLQDKEIDGVLLCCISIEPTVAISAAVLKPYESTKQKIYAIADLLDLTTAPVKSHDITYLEIIAPFPLEEITIEPKLTPYLYSETANSCAVSTLVNAGYKGLSGEIASFIKTILCIYYRYLPPVTAPNQPQNLELWQKSPFYIHTEAKPWFTETGVDKRVAAINNIANSNLYWVISEETAIQQRDNGYLEQMSCYLFPLAAPDVTTLLNDIRTLQQTIEQGDLKIAATQAFKEYQQQGNLTLAIVGKNKPELLKECDRALTGIVKAYDTGKDWQTPVGSYFTPHSLGNKGKVAYVYPGAYNAHLGLGKDLFRLFPNLIDDPVIQSTCNRVAGIDKLLYPRSCHKLSPRELEAKERELMSDPLAMLESETGFAGLFTTILRDYFKVQPQASFGYSLGETSMMYAQGVWSDINQTSNVLNTSPLFKTRLSNTKDAVREYWQLSPQHEGELWRTYVVMGCSEQIKERLATESRVYLTQINTPQEVIIAGDPRSCEKVIESLECDAFAAPFNHVIHCDAIKSEYDELLKLNNLPLRNVPNIPFYSAAGYEQIDLNSSSEIAHKLTQNLIQQLDFSRLVNRVYQDEFRIFIEVGAGSNCSRWIKQILKDKEHATVSLHRRGTNDFVSLVKAIAKLLSHGVKLDLSILYPLASNKINNNSDELVTKTVHKNTQLVEFKEQKIERALLDLSLDHRVYFTINAVKSNSFAEHIVTVARENNLKIEKQNIIKNKVIKNSNYHINLKKNITENKSLKNNNYQTKLKKDIASHRHDFSDSLEEKLHKSRKNTSKVHTAFIKQTKEHCTNTETTIKQQIEILQKIIQLK